MANYIKPKLNWSLIKIPSRRLSNKLDALALTTTTSQTPEEDRPDLLDDINSNRVRYNVCRDRTTTCQKFVFEKKPESGDEYLEPSPEQLQNNLENAGAETTALTTNGYRMFTASTTYKNVTLPLKSSKLANPFPEPVKVMPSHTVSDQEKAEQMQAECRIPRSITRNKAMN
ncbi:hypothetical protein NQ315_006291 [Exocentrus adspersus]|uniref:Uncharacterized protein n=1 Tax=Exocentrus adspersus TaxID=1586481 RepID=A0AAV8W0X1_9CUCU|nr:hypothetical protein NQ315_006291 [Exocentrus adspersus]